MTVFYNKASQMDPHVSRLVVPVTVIDYGNNCIWRNPQTGDKVVEISDVHAVHAIKKSEDYDLDALLTVDDSELSELLSKNRGVFAISKHDCGRVDTSVMEVKIQGHDPPSLRQYNYPDEANSYIQRTVDSLLEQGVIRPCFSPLLAPIWPVRKPDDSWRLCIDYREQMYTDVCTCSGFHPRCVSISFTRS